MDAIEKAIRSAFEKGDPSQRPFREKVYRSAFAALDRALQANPNVTQEMVARRRRTLQETIAGIESEFIPAVPAVEPAAVQPGPSAPVPEVEAAAPEPEAPASTLDPPLDRPEPAFEPTIAPEDRPSAAPPPSDASDDEIEPPAYPDYARRQRRGRPWLSLLVTAAVLAAAGYGAWWAFDRGLISLPAGRDGSVPNPPVAIEDEDFSPEEPPRIVGAPDNLDDWIVIFEPSDPTTVTAPGDSSAEVLEEDGEPFIRIGAGASGSPVLFDVGQGVLEQVAGRRAVFNIVAQAQEGQETQISVDCSLGELGDCGRKRYAVGVTREEFLFEMTLPAVDPGSGGTIAINPDIENGGRTVDIYAIRVSPAG